MGSSQSPGSVGGVFRWWMPPVAVQVGAIGLVVIAAASGAAGVSAPAGGLWWAVTLLSHLPLAVILLFQIGGLVERVGYFRHGRVPAIPGRLPEVLPRICIQLPMFNEHAVARRAIEAACALNWPPERLSVQVLDDSTDSDTRALVQEVCDGMRDATGVDCWVVRRTDRKGYKAGALEIGRHRTNAEFIVILDADFLVPPDYLHRVIPFFYLADGSPDSGLAMVQAQWGHLNHNESALTRAQSFWVDDHHTLQMSWRSARWQFVNFTGTAGVWRASAIDVAGGWRAASLVEDCELSFRNLFVGYRTMNVKDVVVPAELPATYTAYKAQQKRWTQGWAQVQRLHLKRLAFDYQTPLPRRIHLLYHMCVTWQWPAWAIWISLLPFLIINGHWFGAFGAAIGLLVYLLPTVVCLGVAAIAASLETRHTYPREVPRVRLIARVVPYLFISTGMLPHQFAAFCEGLFGSMHSEFERTPKAGTAGAPARGRVRIHWPYVVTEALFVTCHASWAILFAVRGMLLCSLGAMFVAGCVLALGFYYGDDTGKVLFRWSRAPRARASALR